MSRKIFKIVSNRSFLFATLLLFCLLIVSCGKQEQKDFSISKPVHVAEVIQGEAPVYIDSIGILTSDSDVNIRSQVTGRIDNCYFSEGQHVKKGDLLFTIDSQLYSSSTVRSDFLDIFEVGEGSGDRKVVPINSRLF